MTPQRLREIAALYAADAVEWENEAKHLRLLARHVHDPIIIQKMGEIDPVACLSQADEREAKAKARRQACRELQEFSFGKGGWSA